MPVAGVSPACNGTRALWKENETNVSRHRLCVLTGQDGANYRYGECMNVSPGRATFTFARERSRSERRSPVMVHLYRRQSDLRCCTRLYMARCKGGPFDTTGPIMRRYIHRASVVNTTNLSPLSCSRYLLRYPPSPHSLVPPSLPPFHCLGVSRRFFNINYIPLSRSTV